VLPCIGFCQDRLPANDAELTVIDYLGFEWKCDFRFVEHNLSISCKIGGEWGMLCKARRLAAGRFLELAVANDSNNHILYLKYVPKSHTDPELSMDYDRKRCLQADAHVFNFAGFSPFPHLLSMKCFLTVRSAIFTTLLFIC